MAAVIPFLLIGAIVFAMILVYGVFFKTELVLPSLIMILMSLGAGLIINIVEPPLPNLPDDGRIVEQRADNHSIDESGDTKEDDSEVFEIEDRLIVLPVQ